MTSQRRTLEFFTALWLLQPSWAGTLLLGIGLDETGRALALASLAAGAAALFLEADAENIRTAQRDGCTTFTVTTLDEALRTLKNEIRQGHAMTVGLSGDTDTWLLEMVERGVQPEYIAQASLVDHASIGTLESRGAGLLSGFSLHRSSHAHDLEQLSAGDWHIAAESASTLRERRAQDMRLLAKLNRDDAMTNLSRQWLRTAPSLFPRALERTFWANASAP